MKRFYSEVAIAQTPQGYEILLDGRAIKTKNKQPVLAPNQALGDHVAQEWRDQEEQIVPDTMPLTQILNTKIDRIAHERSQIHATVMKYLNTDLICYFAATPDALVAAQTAHWQQWIDWLNETLSVKLKTTSGLIALSQDDEVHAGVHHLISEMSNDEFTILQLVSSLSGSLILALAFTKGVAKVDDVFQSSFVEEHYKNELYDAQKYGLDPMLEKKQRQMRIDLDACEVYLKNL